MLHIIFMPAPVFCPCSKAKLSVVVSGEESPTHQGWLAAALRRAEAAEAELARAAAAAGKAAAAPAAEVRRLRAALEASQAEADMLRSGLAAAARARSPSRGAGRRSGGGLGSELEDAADEARLQQLEAQVESLRGQLAAADAERARLAARCAQLEQQLGGPGQQTGQQEAAEAGAARLDAARLRAEKAALKEECRRLRQEAVGNAAEIEHLTLRLQQLAGSKGTSGGKGQGTSRQQCPAKPAEVQEAGAARGAHGIGSPIEEPAAARSCSPAAPQCPGSAHSIPPQQGSQEARAAAPAASPPGRRVAASPSEGDKATFRREMQHTLHAAERPGVVSRFPHSLGSFLGLRGDLEASRWEGRAGRRQACAETVW